MNIWNKWPTTADGRAFDYRNVFTLTHSGSSPFRDQWDVKLLIQEMEEHLDGEVADIPFVSKGSNNYRLFGPKGYFSDLGEWAERRMQEFEVVTETKVEG